MPSNSVQLEMIVRPSAAASIRPAYPTALLATVATVENAKTWGSSGNSIFDLRAHAASTIKPAKWPESDRMYDEVKVKSKDDPEVFISTEVMTQFRSIDPQTGRVGFTQKFPPPAASADVEITSRNNTRTSNLK
jgi:hypothetical protein